MWARRSYGNLCGLATNYINTSQKQESYSFIPTAEEDGSGAQKCFQTKFADFNLIMFCLAHLPGYQKKSDCS
jgi:hypothetical protein